jgi:chemotaxis protein histidine kinase CheA
MDVNERIDNFLKLQEKNLKFVDISKELGISQSTLRTFLNKKGYKSIKGKYILKNDLNDKVEDKLNDKKDNNIEKNVEQLDFANVTGIDDVKENSSNTKAKLKKEEMAKKDDKKTQSNTKKQVSKKETTKQTTDKTVNNKTTSNHTKTKQEENKTSTRKNTTTKQSASKQTTKKESVKKDSTKENSAKKDTVKKTKTRVDRKINVTQEDLDKLCEVYDWYLQVKDYANDNLNKIKKSDEKDIFVEDEKIVEFKSTSIRVDLNIWNEFDRLCSNSKYSKSVILTQALKDFMKKNKDLL